MDRADLISLASPPCHQCGGPVQRVETKWRFEDGDWRPEGVMVCESGHRVRVEANSK